MFDPTKRVTPNEDHDEGAIRRSLRRRLRSIFRTDADLIAFCLDYLPGLSRFGDGMYRLAKENLILESVAPDQLDEALTSWQRDNAGDFLYHPARSRRDPLLERVMTACRHKEKRHPCLRIEPAPFEGPVRGALISYEEDGMEVRYALGVTAKPVNRALLSQFVEMVHEEGLDTPACRRPRLVYQTSAGVEHPTAELLQAARSLPVPVALVSLDDYEALLQLKDPIARQTERIDRDPRYPARLYVPQRMDQASGTGLRFAVHGQPALETVVDWLERDGGRFVLILGDFGTGKTFLLREVARRLGQPGSAVTPLICELRDIEKHQELDSLLVQHMQHEGIEPIDPQALRHMCRLGKVVLLFDGFDELALRTDYHRAAQHLETLIHAVDGDAKVLVTSRTQHFLTDTQIATVLAQRLERVPTLAARLRAFEPEQVRQFLENQLNDAAEAQVRLQLLGEVKDLLGLSKNPRMLSLIAQIDPGRLRTMGQVGAAQLYQALVDQWIEGEIKRKSEGITGRMLTATQLMHALDRLARRLWRKLEPTAELAELEEVTAGVLDKLEHEVGVATQQFGSSSLLCRDEKGRFAFYHHSLLEWFIARQAAAEVAGGTTAPLLSEKPLTPLAAEFLRGFLGEEQSAAWARQVLAGTDTDTDETSLLVQSALVLAQRMNLTLSRGPNLHKADLRGRDLSQLDLRQADLRGADLREALLTGKDLSGVDLREANLADANLRKANLSRADLRGANLSRANLLGADLRGAKMAGAVLRRAKLLAAKLDPDSLKGEDTFGAAVAEDLVPMLLPRSTQIESDDLNPLASPNGELSAAETQNHAVALYDDVHCLRLLVGHTASISTLAFSLDARMLATAAIDGMIKIWDVESGVCRFTLDGHTGGINEIAFSQDGSKLASGSLDQTVKVWDLTSGVCRHTLKGHTESVANVIFDPAGINLESISSDGTVKTWEMQTGRCLRTLNRDTMRADHRTYLSDHMMEPKNPQERRNQQSLLKGNHKEILGVVFGETGRTLTVDSGKGTVAVWNLAIGVQLTQVRSQNLYLESEAYSPDGSTLARSDDGLTVHLTEVATGRCRAILLADVNGWIVLDPELGRYRSEGNVNDVFWFAAGLCRFAPSELEEFFPHLRLPEDHRFLPEAPTVKPASSVFPRSGKVLPNLALAKALVVGACLVILSLALWVLLGIFLRK